MPVALGAQPDTLTVHLTAGSDFIATLTNQGGDWEAGAVVTLVFDYASDEDASDTTWTADIVGADATFDVDKAEADTIPTRTKVELRYALGDLDQVWARGAVFRA